MKKNWFLKDHSYLFSCVKKIVKIMRLSIFLVVLTSLQSLAINNFAQSGKLNIKVQNTTVSEVLQLIEKESGYFLFYNNKVLDLDEVVTLDLTNKSVTEVLDALLKDKAVSYTINKKQIVLSKKQSNRNLQDSLQQQKSVSGKVTDENGEPLPGVTVLIKGTANGTVTNFDGEYTITNISASATLQFSFVGMKTQEVIIGKETTVDITLVADAIGIEEVVAIGYGTLKSSQLSSSITSVSSEALNERSVSRLDQALQGKAAGVQIQEVSGAPGRSLSVKIRGTGSINNSTSPLYVVDGFPISGDLNSINPGDVESVEILKDAASAAIYGSRGANGVVLITTKSGKAGENVIEVDAYVGIQERFSKVDVFNRDEYIEYALEERINSYVYAGGDLSVPETERRAHVHAIDPVWRTNPKSLPDHDWQDLIDRVAPVQSYTLSASGGTEKGKYFISANYFDQQGILLASDYKRYSAIANVDSKLNDWLSVGLNLSVSNSNRNEPDNDTNMGPVSRSILVAPIVDINQQTVEGGYYTYHGSWMLNPIALSKEVTNNTQSSNIRSMFYGSITPVKNLVLRSSFGADITSNKWYYYKTDNVNRGRGSFGMVSNSYIQNYLNENTLMYNFDVDDLSVDLLGGLTYQEQTYDYSYLHKAGFADDDVRTLNAGTELKSGTSTKSKWSLISYLARTNMNYRDKYMLTASIRRDGSSRFGKNNRWGVFPSLSLGWNVSQEEFMDKTKDVVSNLKVRASIGTVGNNNIGDYSGIGLMSSTNYIVDGNVVGGYSPSTFSNDDLGWETTATTDIGVDLGVFNNRVNLTFDYYVSNTRDLLLNVQIPQVTGASNALQNIGKVQNRGYEVELLTKNLTGKFKWTTSFNVAHNKNEVKALGSDGSPIINYGRGIPLTITQIGSPIGSYYLFKQDGLFKDQADVDQNAPMAYLNNKPQPGDYKFTDINGDGQITLEDKTIVGHNSPDYFWGLTNTFNYKAFELSVFCDGQWGNKLLNLAKMETVQSAGNLRGYWRDRWKSEAEPGNGVVPRAANTANMKVPKDFWLEDAAFWRIRTINLTYNLPQETVAKLPGIRGLKIYAGIDNVFMKDNYNHMSETAAYSNNNSLPGIDFDSGYPLARTFKLGINIKLK